MWHFLTKDNCITILISIGYGYTFILGLLGLVISSSSRSRSKYYLTYSLVNLVYSCEWNNMSIFNLYMQ